MVCGKPRGRRNRVGATPLIMAAHAGLSSIVHDLLQRGALPNAKNGQGYTALMIAARAEHADIVKLLIEAGADRSLRNFKRETAADIATSVGNTAIAQMLKQMSRRRIASPARRSHSQRPRRHSSGGGQISEQSAPTQLRAAPFLSSGSDTTIDTRLRQSTTLRLPR